MPLRIKVLRGAIIIRVVMLVSFKLRLRFGNSYSMLHFCRGLSMYLLDILVTQFRYISCMEKSICLLELPQLMRRVAGLFYFRVLVYQMRYRMKIRKFLICW